MKALTLWQPWASLIAIGEKKVETRSWSTKYRGDLAIHAAAQIPPKWLGASRFEPEFRKEFADALRSGDWQLDSWNLNAEIKKLPRAAIVCFVRLIDIEPTENVVASLSPREIAFGNYEEGRYAWFFELIYCLEKPLPAKGNRMLWNWRGE